MLRLYSIVHVAMETTKMSNFTCESKSFINIFSTCQVSAGELQPFSCHNLANDIYSETAKTVFSHLKHATFLISAGSLFESARVAVAVAEERAPSVGSIFCEEVAAEYCCLSGDRG